MRLTPYVRVSTDAQASEGSGLDVQREQITRWAKTHGHRLAQERCDAGISGAEALEGRHGLLGALEDVRLGLSGGIVVYRLDRLARDLVAQESLLSQVRSCEGEMFSCSDTEASFLGDDSADPARTLVRQVLGAVSQYERSMISLRMQAGRQRKAREGGYAGGAPPLGQRPKDGELVQDESEARTVELIVSLSAEGHSSRQICAVLCDQGRPTKRGGRWHPATVSRVLKRQVA